MYLIGTHEKEKNDRTGVGEPKKRDQKSPGSEISEFLGPAIQKSSNVRCEEAYSNLRCER